MHATIQNSSNLGPSLNFAKAPLYVTKHHDSEFSSAHASNAYDPYNPVVDFAKYLNGENLEQEECVRLIFSFLFLAAGSCSISTRC